MVLVMNTFEEYNIIHESTDYHGETTTSWYDIDNTLYEEESARKIIRKLFSNVEMFCPDVSEFISKDDFLEAITNYQNASAVSFDRVPVKSLLARKDIESIEEWNARSASIPDAPNIAKNDLFVMKRPTNMEVLMSIPVWGDSVRIEEKD